MGGSTHPSLLFALTYGFLTSLTPCVYPMIPITVSIFGARAGVPRRRAIVLATLYVAGIAVMFGALGTTFALLGKAFGTFLANPWVIVPLALFFVAMGRRCSARSSSSSRRGYSRACRAWVAPGWPARS